MKINVNNTHVRVFFKKYLKYIIALMFFAVVVIFIDDHNLISRIRISRQISNIEAEIDTLEKGIKKDKQQIIDLQDGGEKVEKFAREHYIFKKTNEDVFVINKKDKSR
ncbi:MAG: septum formation initiator family protein [Paludibacter sp.]|nr:septum formation initiator family protein [Paludibacter sp.]